MIDFNNELLRAVITPSVIDMAEASRIANEIKERELEEVGFNVDHKITSGDVRCVLKAVQVHVREMMT